MGFVWKEKTNGKDFILAEDINALAGGIIEALNGIDETKKYVDASIQAAILKSWEVPV